MDIWVKWSPMRGSVTGSIRRGFKRSKSPKPSIFKLFEVLIGDLFKKGRQKTVFVNGDIKYKKFFQQF